MGLALMEMVIGTVLIFATDIRKPGQAFWKGLGVACLMLGTYRLALILAGAPL